jgi:hypothetical protein
MVGIGVMVGVVVTVAVTVGEGEALPVAVGSGAASAAPPQAVNNKDIANIISIKCFIKFLREYLISKV